MAIQKIRHIWDRIRPQGSWVYVASVVGGIFVGLFAYTFIASNAYTYLSDDPATCVNCHNMAPYHATWFHSSHARNATCNDCHVPNNNIISKYFFKAKDGLRHAAMFSLRREEQALQATNASAQVIMNNCIRCHTQLNTEFVNTGRFSYMEAKVRGGSACWDCHRDIAHTRSRSETSTPHALTPMPKSNVPDWLKEAIKNKIQ